MLALKRSILDAKVHLLDQKLTQAELLCWQTNATRQQGNLFGTGQLGKNPNAMVGKCLNLGTRWDSDVCDHGRHISGKDVF